MLLTIAAFITEGLVGSLCLQLVLHNSLKQIFFDLMIFISTCNIFLEPVQYVCRPELFNAHHDLDFMLFWTSICWHIPMAIWHSTHPVCQPVWLTACVFTSLLVASLQSLLLTLLESRLGNGEDSLSWESETYLLWKVLMYSIKKLITFLLQLFVITSGIISSLSIMNVIQSRRQRIHESLCFTTLVSFILWLVDTHPSWCEVKLKCIWSDRRSWGGMRCWSDATKGERFEN